jgi:predicted secreted protein
MACQAHLTSSSDVPPSKQTAFIKKMDQISSIHQNQKYMHIMQAYAMFKDAKSSWIASKITFTGTIHTYA